MKQTLTIEVPTSWQDITLDTYLKMQTELDNYRDNEEAQTAIMLLHLCKIQPEYLKGLSAESYHLLKSKLAQFISPNDIELSRFITIDGIEYGFEPNLSKMAYGAYADVSQYDTLSIDKNWPKIMAILYRPVVEKYKSGQYRIEPYTGEVEHERWLNISMDIHFGCLFFFINLLMDLLKDTLNSTMEMELPHNIKQILARSGNLIKQYTNLQMETLKK
jgi:hypothetical protein